MRMADIAIVIGSNHIRAMTDEFTFTSKLVDGKFPDYQSACCPGRQTRPCSAPASNCARPSARTAILSNEKYRGVRLKITDNSLDILANNPEQEEAEETVTRGV